jgi:hypothetical protein
MVLNQTTMSTNYTDKKENNIFLTYKEIRWERLRSHIRLMASSYTVWLNICAFPHILGRPSSNITLQLLPSEFPYIWRILFLFYQRDGFHNFGSFSWRKFKIKFLLASMKSLTNSENPSRKPFQEACSGFQVTAYDSKSCSESRLFRKLVWHVKYTGKNRPMTVKDSREQEFWCGIWNNL